MRNVQTFIIIVGLLFSLAASAQHKQTPTVMKKIEPLPRDLEIQLALSALPPHLRDNATVYVLNPDKGFEVARKGTNGFHTFVARTGDDTFRGSWPLTEYRDDILYPVSFDAAGAKAQMRVFFDAAEMQAKGTFPTTQIGKFGFRSLFNSICSRRCGRLEWSYLQKSGRSLRASPSRDLYPGLPCRPDGRGSRIP